MYGQFAEVYDRLMRDVDYDAWAAYLAELFALCSVPNDGLVLECACGTGALTVRLAARGYRMVASDVSEAMLAQAQERARKRGLHIPFVQQDMRALAAHHAADAVICACDGVNYLTSAACVSRFLKSTCAALKDGGALLFDVSSAYKLARVLGCNTFGEADEDCAYLWRNMFDEKSRLLEMRLSFFVRDGERYRRFDETHIQRAHTVAELTRLMREAGFDEIAVYDAFTQNPPSPETERVQFVARKRA